MKILHQQCTVLCTVLCDGRSLVDVKSLLTNLHLEYTFDLVLKRIYDNGELTVNITKSEMKRMLTLCTKDVHFTFNSDTHLQPEEVAVGSTLCPFLNGIFIIHLKDL